MYVTMHQAKTIVPLERIEKVIFLIRGQRVILDSHLAVLYGVETKALKRAVRRNLERFPSDFLLELTTPEYKALRRQFGTLEKRKIESHDEGIRTLFEAIRRLMSPAPLPCRRIGFNT